jgi:molecular chaperone HscC
MIVGIDLGTTNSAIGVWRDGAAELIPNALGHKLTPSVVGFTDDGELVVGLAARERLFTHPASTASIFKRYMGSQKKLQLGKKSFHPEELSALLLQALKRDAEAALGETITEAVITVPAYFNDTQRKATRRAGELAGLKVERLLNEPTAAALAYGIQELDNESRFLVFDLGGGTFDVSVLEIFDGVIEVRASAGDNWLGGEDFSEALIDLVFAKFKAEWKVAEKTTDALLYQRLRSQAERVKRDLSQAAISDFTVAWKDQEWTLPITDTMFEEAVAPVVQKIREPIVRALRDSRLKPEDLTQVVLVGGATRMPIIRKAVTRMFGRFPATTIDPDEAIALGATVQAALKSRDAALKEVVLTDVCPYTLGVETSRKRGKEYVAGLFSPIIERNTVIPASRSDTFYAIDDRQREVRFAIYQGESRYVKDNIKLGEISVTVPPGKATEIGIDVRFTYDINGLLDVDVNVPATNTFKNLTIVNSSESMSEADIEERRKALADLKVAPREMEANRAALARASRCYEMFLDQTRDYVATLIDTFEGALDTQDPRTIDHARAQLIDALDKLEGESYL